MWSSPRVSSTRSDSLVCSILLIRLSSIGAYHIPLDVLECSSQIHRQQMARVREQGVGLIGTLFRLISSRRIVRIALLVAVVLGVTAGVSNFQSLMLDCRLMPYPQSMSGSSDQSTLNTSATLRRVSVYIFLAVSACLVLLTANLAFYELQGTRLMALCACPPRSRKANRGRGGL